MSAHLTDDDERLAGLAHQFLQTPYGQYVLEKLAALNYALHQEAEQQPTSEAIALKVVEAKGLRRAVELLTSNAALYEAVKEAERKATQ
jgi:hypothetical protein